VKLALRRRGQKLTALGVGIAAVVQAGIYMLPRT
jgi:hypothetical protein